MIRAEVRHMDMHISNNHHTHGETLQPHDVYNIAFTLQHQNTDNFTSKFIHMTVILATSILILTLTLTDPGDTMLYVPFS